jgi:hypothetical protein
VSNLPTWDWIVELEALACVLVGQEAELMTEMGKWRRTELH